MKTENKLRFGHRVIAWDKDKSKAVKGRYVYFSNGYYEILEDDRNETEGFKNCELDPEATEFVIGDEVEVKLNDGTWVLTEYCGKLNEVNEYLAVYDHETSFKHCRYPQPEPEQPEHKLAELIEKTAELMELLKKFGKSE